MGYLGRLALIIGAAALFAGCGGSQPPIYGKPQTSATASRGHGSSGSASALIYVSDLLLNVVNVYSYTDGHHVLTLTGFTNPAGVCSDTSGNVFVLGNRNDDIIEYAHGAKTPTQTLDVPGWAAACAYDSRTGNLAVVFDSEIYGTGVAVFASEQGTPIIYYSGLGTVISYCGYDYNSDLFCDGSTESVRAAFFALGSGSKEIRQVPVSGGEFYELNQIQWDGQYMAATDLTFDTVSRITFTRGFSPMGHLSPGFSGTVMSVTTLDNCGYYRARSSWIYDGSILAACTLESPYQKQDKVHVRIWQYPQGGKPVRTIAKREATPNLPDGVTISVAASK